MAAEPQTASWGDRELVVAFQEGRPGAYDEVYRRYHPRVRRVCGQLVGNPADADEATQETFLRAYRALPRFNGRYQLGAWLARIAANVCVDHLRSRSRSQLVALPVYDSDLVSEPGPESAVADQDPRVHQAIRDMQPLHARALEMRALDGMSHQEMANDLAMSPTQVKALLHRARNSFKRAWEKAEGWLLAPVGGWKLWGNRSEAQASSSTLVTTAPSVGFVAEKVATSAMFVVVALSGIPSSPTTSGSIAPQPSPTMAARVPVAVTTGQGTTRHDAEHAVAAAAEDAEASLPELLSGSLSGEARVPQGDSGSRSEASNDDPLEPTTGRVEALSDELRQKLHEVIPPDK